MSHLNSAAITLLSLKKMAPDVVVRKQLMKTRVVVEPNLITFPHSAAESIYYYKYKDIR